MQDAYHSITYVEAVPEHAQQVYELVQHTITSVYPKHYPREVVEFFRGLHQKERVINDIKSGYVYILLADNQLVGTGSLEGNHITRVFVSPAYQGLGYGSYIMRRLENEIALKYNTACLEASLPAVRMYGRRGYQTVEHKKLQVENGVALVYEVMEKQLPVSAVSIGRRGKVPGPAAGRCHNSI